MEGQRSWSSFTAKLWDYKRSLLSPFPTPCYEMKSALSKANCLCDVIFVYTGKRCPQLGKEYNSQRPGCMLMYIHLDSPGTGSLMNKDLHFLQDIYESMDIRQRRASSPGYIDSPTYSRQGISPTIPRSPHHYYRSGRAWLSPSGFK